MADNDGVTQLLKAEAEANKIIQQAHEERCLIHPETSFTNII